MGVTVEELDINNADSAAANYSPQEPGTNSVPLSAPVRQNFQSLAKMNELRVSINRNDNTKLRIHPGHYFRDRQTVEFNKEQPQYGLSSAVSNSDNNVDTRGTGRWILLGIDTTVSEPGVTAHVEAGSDDTLPDIPADVAPVAFVKNIASDANFTSEDIIDARNIVKPPRLQSSLTY